MEHGASNPIAWPQWVVYCRAFLEPLRTAHPTTYGEVWRRVERHWSLLDREVWAPLVAHVHLGEGKHPAAIARRWGDPDNAGALCALVLEAAAWWVVQSKDKATTTPAKAKRLQEVEGRLRDTLCQAVALLDERANLNEHDGLHCDPPAINGELEDLIEIAAELRPGWHGVVQHELAALLSLSRRTTNVSPTLRDLLDAAIRWPLGSDVIATRADDAEVLRPNAGGSRLKTAGRVRQFLAELDDKLSVRDIPGMPGPVTWIGPTALAHLLSVVECGECASTGGDASGAFNAEAVGKARREYCRQTRKGSSTD